MISKLSKTRIGRSLVFLLTLCLLLTSAPGVNNAQAQTGSQATTADHNKQVIGYITQWDAWKAASAGLPSQGALTHLNIDFSQYTILNYSFFGVANDGSLHSGDFRDKNIYKPEVVQAPAPLLYTDIYSSWDLYLLYGEIEAVYYINADVAARAAAMGFEVTVGGSTWSNPAWGLYNQSLPLPLKKAGGAPGLFELADQYGVKVMASIGGWSMCKHFYQVAADPVKRAKFISDCKKLMAMGFDGIDLDWEYPGPFSGMNFTGTQADYANFLTLVREIRQAIGADKLITSCFSADTAKLGSFNWVELDKVMNYYNFMTYDFNGGWSDKAGHNSPLYPYTNAEAPAFNWDSLYQYLATSGINMSKVNMGTPFYGRGVITNGAASLNAATVKRAEFVQPDGNITTCADYTNWPKEVYDGTPYYYYIKKTALASNSGWTRHWDNEAKVPYLTKDKYFLSYDDEESIGYKAQYIKDKNLAGTIIWTVYEDLELGGTVTNYGTKLKKWSDVKSPLVNKINNVFADGYVPNPTVATPAFSVPGGAYESAQNVAITCATADAEVRYTLDGTEPTALSTLYTGAINIASTATLKAKGFKADMNASVTASATYTIGVVPIETVAPPVFSVPGGTYTSAQTVAITCATAGATIRYTTDGSEPTASSNLYSSSITISATTTLKAKAFKAGMNDSSTVTAAYTIDDGGTNPVEPWKANKSYVQGDIVSYNGKNYECRQSHTSLPGWEPPNVPALWLEYNGSVDPVGTVATSTFSPAGGTYTSAQNVTISCATSGAEIRYTLDGTEPTASSTLYTGALSITSTKTLKAKGFKTGMNASAIASATYNISEEPVGTVAAPAFDIPGGTYASAQNVAITCATAGAEIRYTLDGAEPTASSALYTGSISIASTKTLKAKGFKTGMNASAVTSATYTINVINPDPAVPLWDRNAVYVKGDRVTWNGYIWEANWWTRGEEPGTTGEWGVWKMISSTIETVATPVFNPPGGNYASAQSVAITCATAGAAIRYTADGSTPTAASSLYSSPISISATTVLKAKAFKTNMNDSSTASATYTFGPVVNDGFKVVGYYPGWEPNKLDRIQYDVVTNINYAFAIPTAQGGLLPLENPDLARSLIAQAHANNVKVSIAVGGWSYNGTELENTFVQATNTDAKIQAFTNAIMNMVNEYGFDGVDMDWEHPRTGQPSQTQYEKLMLSLSSSLKQKGKLLTAAVLSGVSADGVVYWDSAAHTDAVLECVDWINVMAYDGGDGERHSSYNFAVNCGLYWRDTRHMPAEKVVLGVPFYGRPSWASYDAILQANPNAYNTDISMINGLQAYYNGIPTIKNKTRWAKQNLGGIMIWELSQDTLDRSKSLLTAIGEAASE